MKQELNKILHIEDDNFSQLMVQQTIERLDPNIQLDICDSIEEGIQKIHREKYDLILLDLVLKGTSGFELIKTLNNSVIDFPNIIVVSGHIDGNSNELERKYKNIIGSLEKPVYLNQLKGILKKRYQLKNEGFFTPVSNFFTQLMSA